MMSMEELFGSAPIDTRDQAPAVHEYARTRPFTFSYVVTNTLSAVALTSPSDSRGPGATIKSPLRLSGSETAACKAKETNAPALNTVPWLDQSSFSLTST